MCVGGGFASCYLWEGGRVVTSANRVQACQGKSWDRQTRSWVEQPSTALVLEDEAFAGSRQRWRPSEFMSSTSGEDDFYTVLGVQRDATPEQIKKQARITTWPAGL